MTYMYNHGSLASPSERSAVGVHLMFDKKGFVCQNLSYKNITEGLHDPFWKDQGTQRVRCYLVLLWRLHYEIKKCEHGTPYLALNNPCERTVEN